jgi:hypothetical protein
MATAINTPQAINSITITQKQMNTYEIFTEKYSEIVHAETMQTALYKFWAKNKPEDKAIGIWNTAYPNRLTDINVGDIPSDSKDSAKMKIYTASKTKHAQKWIDLRDAGFNVISTWIDEACEGQTKDMRDLVQRCISECVECDGMIVYSEGGDYLKGAFIEMGVAVAHNKPIVLVGPVLPQSSAFTYLSNIKRANDIPSALKLLSGSSPSPLKEELTEGRIEAMAIGFADSKERRGCASWSGRKAGFIAGYKSALGRSGKE